MLHLRSAAKKVTALAFTLLSFFLANSAHAAYYGKIVNKSANCACIKIQHSSTNKNGTFACAEPGKFEKSIGNGGYCLEGYIGKTYDTASCQGITNKTPSKSTKQRGVLSLAGGPVNFDGLGLCKNIRVEVNSAGEFEKPSIEGVMK